MANKNILKALFIIVFASFNSVLITKVFSQTYPGGFSQVQVTPGLVKPTSMAFSPDGRIFVTLQGGQCRIIQNGSLLPAPFISLSVNMSGERGLLGIAFDPNFATNNYIYLYYTLSTAVNNRISRFTANGNVVVPGSEVVLLDLDSIGTIDYHNGGCMKFGPDGKLYVGIGDNGLGANAQNLDTYHGKVIRINPDGTIPPGNPYTSGSAQRQRVWSYGLRNPYTLDFHPTNGRLFVNDVGQGSWEEINEGTTSNRNFGWPTAEGNSSNPLFTNPVYTYAHGTGSFIGCAITGGAFFNSTTTNYPSQYQDKYFFVDYCQKWLNYISITGPVNVTNFGTALNNTPLSLTLGIDGNLYYLSYGGAGGSALFKIIYTPGTSPTITQHPQSLTVNAGQSASFTVSASGSNPLSYQWQKNGTNIANATNSIYNITNAAATDAGNYRVVVTNFAGTTTSNSATLTVNTQNTVPIATINNPASGTFYTAGQTINFSGSGFDQEDGNLPASSINWEVYFHHDTHTHPGPSVPQGVSSGSFVIPNQGETSANVFYRLYCYVTDSQGAIDTGYVDILPLVSNITIVTNPSGLEVTIEGQPQNSPYTTSSVEGFIRTIGVTSPQSFFNVTYTFQNWADGGTNPKNITTPVNNTTYTANLTCSIPTPTSITSNAANNTICSGSNVTLSLNGGTLAIGGSYNWFASSCGGTPVGTGVSISVSPSVTTTYYARSQASCGTSNCVSITISVIPFNPTITGNTTFCAGASNILTANTGAGISYQWYRNTVLQSGATSNTFNANSNGTYYVVETSTCGTAQSNSIVVSQINNPTPSISYSTPLSFCSPGNVVLTSSTFSGVSYQWQKNSLDVAGATLRNYTATTNGTYRVRQTANGCFKYAPAVTVTTTTSVTAAITANGPVTFCTGGSVVLSVNNAIPGYSYQWKNNGTNIANATQSSYTATTSGSYTCLVTASCGNATSNAIVVSTGGITALVTPAGTVSICSGATVALSANTGNGYTFQWRRNGTNIAGATASTYNTTTAGSYTVAITSPCGNATSAATTVNIAALTATISPVNPSICAGSAQTFTANGGYNYSYQWFRNGIAQAGATNQTYANSSNGSYTVRITQGTACTVTSSISTLTVINNPTPTVTPQGPTTFCNGQSVVLTTNTFAGVTYQWQKNSVNIAGATNQNYTAATAGAYRVRQTANGCTKSSPAVTVTVNCREAGDIIGDVANSDEAIKVMPNPFSDELTIYGLEFKAGDKLQLINMLGKVIINETITKASPSGRLVGLSSLKTGVYFLNVITSKEKKTVKVVKP